MPGVNSKISDAGGNWFRYYLEVPQLCPGGDNSVGESGGADESQAAS